MDKKNEYVLIIGKLQEGSEVQLVNELGYKTIVFNKTLNLKQVLEADVPVEVNLNCETTVLNKAKEISKKYPIVAVFTLNEYRVELSAKVRESLGLKHGISSKAANNCRNKKNTRELLKALGDRAVKYYLVHSCNEADEVISQMQFPIVVKPSNDAGSNMVFCCRRKTEVNEAVNQILNTNKNSVGDKLDHVVLIEEFLEGPEFSVESYTKEGITTIIEITAKKILSPFNPIEIGHTVPASLTQSEREDIETIVKDAIKLLDINETVTHTEVKLTERGARIVEVNARPGGDKIPVLVKSVTGYDLHKISLQLALGMDIDKVEYCPCRPKKADIRFFLADTNGEVVFNNLCELYSMENIKQVKMQVKNGSQVTKTTSNYDRLGWFIAYNLENKLLDDLVNRVNVKEQKCCCK